MANISGLPLVKAIAREPGNVEVFALDGGRLRIVLRPHNASLFIPRHSWDTELPLGIVELMAARFEFPWVCDHLARLEDPAYVAETLRRQLFAYFSPRELTGKRLLDFGCGAGASTVIMAGLLPETEIAGAELDPVRVDIARRIAAHKGLTNVRFYTSPSPDSLPDEIGSVDFIMLSAVYEHLLPGERRILMPVLWSRLRSGGALLINQTPFRWAPYEGHTTGLWCINYLPDSLAGFAARHFSRLSPEANRRLDWNGLLRHGLRGGTERQILRNLRRGGGPRGVILQPTQGNLRDRAAYWMSATSPRHAALKRLICGAFRLCDRALGIVPSTNIDVVIRKP